MRRNISAVGWPLEERGAQLTTYEEMRPGCYDPVERLVDIGAHVADAILAGSRELAHAARGEPRKPGDQPGPDQPARDDQLGRVIDTHVHFREPGIVDEIDQFDHSDAEESERLEISLVLLEGLMRDPTLDGWQGLGLAVQAGPRPCAPRAFSSSPGGRRPRIGRESSGKISQRAFNFTCRTPISPVAGRVAPWRA